MILINLLPHREAAKIKRKRDFNLALGTSAIAGVLLAFAGYTWLQSMISNQQERNAYLVSQNKSLDEQIKEVAGLEQEISALKARQQAVEDLQADRNLPVQMINELVAFTPDGIHLKAIKQEGMTLVMTGVAQSNERVSEYLRKLSRESQVLVNPQLIEIVAGKFTVGKTSKPVFDFTMRATVQRPKSEGSEKSSSESGVKNG